MSITKKILALSLCMAAAAPAMAELSGNVSATSNYLWRGVTQNGDAAAVQGGIDYSHDSGLYVGTWVSSLGPAASGSAYEGYELDLYGGYQLTAGSVGLDLGAIAYAYPVKDTSGVDNDDSFYEFYLGASMDAFSAKVSYSSDTDLSKSTENAGTYIEAAYTAGPMTFHVGNYSFDKGTDYTDYSIALAKDEFTFGVSNTDLTGSDDPRVFVSYSKDFSL